MAIASVDQNGTHIGTCHLPLSLATAGNCHWGLRVAATLVHFGNCSFVANYSFLKKKMYFLDGYMWFSVFSGPLS